MCLSKKTKRATLDYLEFKQFPPKRLRRPKVRICLLSKSFKTLSSSACTGSNLTNQRLNIQFNVQLSFQQRIKLDSSLSVYQLQDRTQDHGISRMPKHRNFLSRYYQTQTTGIFRSSPTRSPDCQEGVCFLVFLNLKFYFHYSYSCAPLQIAVCFFEVQ